jgi:putative copper resistance protein D
MYSEQLVVIRAAHLAAAILLAGIFTFTAVILRGKGCDDVGAFHGIERRLLRVAFWSLITAFVSGLLWCWVEVASMNSLPLKAALARTAWQPVLFDTLFGRVWRIRLSLMMGLFVLVALTPRKATERRATRWMPWLLGMVCLGSLAWISHAAAAAGDALGLGSDTLHLCAAGVWIGGLTPLAIFLSSPCATGHGAMGVLRRFSTVSLCCVSILLASGVFNSCLLLGSVHALLTTPYGRLVFLKIILFAILVCLGGCNRFLIRRALPGETNATALSRLRHNVLCEVCLGAVVVILAACLGVTPPARHL